jgi:uncharacterized membrane protein YeaQ/YmgE (transglycosylase-associated protein family)
MSPRAKLRLVVLLGLLAPIWWTWSVGQLTFAIYTASGSPLRPTLSLLWASVYAPSFVLGFVAGFAAAQLSQESPMKGWVIFCVSLLVGAAFQSVLTGAALWDCLAAFFGSYGNVFFWVGSLLWPAAASWRRARRSR